jgi:hypothetical protein
MLSKGFGATGGDREAAPQCETYSQQLRPVNLAAAAAAAAAEQAAIRR